jgi:hypothetical protein
VAEIMKVWAAEAPPPGLGLLTVTLARPMEAIRPAGTVAVISPALTQEVESGNPFHCTVAAFSKFEPNTNRVMPGVPGATLLGAIEVSVGMSRGVRLPPPPALSPPAPPPQPASRQNRRTPCSTNAGRGTIRSRTALIPRLLVNDKSLYERDKKASIMNTSRCYSSRVLVQPYW